jgi:hypothetical protein
MSASVRYWIPLSVSNKRVLFSVRGGQVVPRAKAAAATGITAAPGVLAQLNHAGCGLILRLPRQD